MIFLRHLSFQKYKRATGRLLSSSACAAPSTVAEDAPPTSACAAPSTVAEDAPPTSACDATSMSFEQLASFGDHTYCAVRDTA